MVVLVVYPKDQQGFVVMGPFETKAEAREYGDAAFPKSRRYAEQVFTPC